MFFVLRRDGGYSQRDITLLTVVLLAALVDLLIAIVGLFVPLWGGVRGMLLHLTTLLCESAILAVTIIVLRSQLANDVDEDSRYNSTVACALPPSCSHTADE